MTHSTVSTNTSLVSLALVGSLALAVSACGGGGSESASPATGAATGSSSSSSVASSASSSSAATSSASSSASSSGAALAASFPTGLAVGSPAEISSSGTSALQLRRTNPIRYAADFGRTFWQSLKQGNWPQLASLGSTLLPGAAAQAADSSDFALASAASSVSSVLSGSGTVDLGTVLNFNDLFRSSNNANCYGPSLQYASHENGTTGSNSGTLPSGDLGLWTTYEGTTTQPCVAAELNQRVTGVKSQAMQGLLMMAAMRQSIAKSSTLAMPTAGNSTDITSDFETLLHNSTSLSSLDVTSATVSLNSGGTTYTYRLVVNNGLTGSNARSGEVIMKHTPGSSSTAYSGVLHVVGFSLTNDSAMACADLTDSTTSMLKAAMVSSIRYTRSNDDVSFSARSSNYCGAAGSSSDLAAEIASFDSNDELDATVKNSTKQYSANTKGWVGNFTRFAGDYDVSTLEGNFQLAWQAGTADGNSRMLAMNMALNTVTSAYTLQGFFGYAASVDTTTGSLSGMICNWAGPGNNHTLLPKFQSQTATMASSATAFTVGTNHITYAPTNNCDSTTTQYDVNLDNTLSTGEGNNVSNDLDGLTGSNSTVQAEILSRGFAVPSLF